MACVLRCGLQGLQVLISRWVERILTSEHEATEGEAIVEEMQNIFFERPVRTMSLTGYVKGVRVKAY